MSTTTISTSSLSDASCRILTIASSLEQAISLIDRVRKLSKDLSSSEPIANSVSSEEDQAFGRNSSIPWTLSNKYYEADVHFHAREIKGLAPAHTSGVPAVIFVWTHGESYRDHIVRIANGISSSHPDVALAVRLPRTRSDEGDEDDTEDTEEDSEIDEFLSSHGFEFIDSDRQHRVGAGSDEEGISQQDIPGLPRVLDSLSTVMWPSMRTRAQSKPKFNRQRFNVFSRSGSSRIDSLRLHKEAEDLVRWLEDDVSLRELIKNDPWKSVSEPGTVCTSPTSLEHPSAPWLLPSKDAPNTLLAFDDDFSDFVSAPRKPSTDSTPQARSPVAHDTQFDEEALRSPFSSSLYRALGSAANLATQDEDDEGGAYSKHIDGSDDEDEDLPSRQEIAATAARIFGSDKSVPPTPPHVNIETETSDSSGSSLFAVDTEHSQNAASMQVVDLYDVGQFDLTRVLDALRGMKAEIASMSDEGERRRAAARVALGLVYGLDAESEDSHVYT